MTAMSEELPLVKPHLAASSENEGKVAIWLVDEHGCHLHTEPVCIAFVGGEDSFPGHPWFLDWLLTRRLNIHYWGLLWHPALGESGKKP